VKESIRRIGPAVVHGTQLIYFHSSLSLGRGCKGAPSRNGALLLLAAGADARRARGDRRRRLRPLQERRGDLPPPRRAGPQVLGSPRRRPPVLPGPEMYASSSFDCMHMHVLIIVG
jgi:hypothetical protein